MTVSVVRFTPDHAKATADLFNNCRHAWPWDFTDGIPYTADHLLTRLGELRTLAVMLAMVDDRPLGFLELTPYPAERNAAYIQLVFVDPGHHGKGLGRRLLQAAVEKTAELGLRRVDLHTWPSNLKAVPLYKKTGFFWVPGTQVWMQNYVPALLQNPLGRGFFDRFCWYETMERETSICPDDERWHGMRSFTYRWRAGDQVLEAVVDREARGVTAISLDDLSLSCRVADHRPLAGARVAMTWTASSGQAVPLTVRGGDHVDVSFDGRLEPGQDEISRYAVIRPSASDICDEEPGPALESTFFVDGSAVTLTTGVRAGDPLKLVTHPTFPVLAPGLPTRLHLGVVNPGGGAVRGWLYVAAGEGLTVAGPTKPFPLDLGPSERAGFPLEVTAASEGSPVLVWWADLDLGDQDMTTPPRQLALPCVDGGEASISRGDSIYMVNQHLILRVRRRGGTFTVTDRGTGEVMVWGTDDRLGPPFHPGEFRTWTYEPEVDGATVRLTAESGNRPGLSWTRDMTLDGHLLVIENRYSYAGTEPAKVELQQAVGPEMDNGIITLPLASGLVRQKARVPEFPGRWRDLTIGDAGWAETWTACEHDGVCIGVMWDGAREVEAEYLTRVTRTVAIAPGEGRADGPLVIYLGPGDWRTVRQRWQEVFGPGHADLPQPGPVLRLRFADDHVGSPLLLGPDGDARLVVENLRRRTVSGRLSVEGLNGWQVTPDGVDLRELGVDSPARLPVCVTGTGGRPSAGAIRGTIQTASGAESFTLPIIDPGHGAGVHVEPGGDSYTVDNGHLRFRVAPGFFASVVSLECEGSEHLLSPYPEPGEFAWLKPWYGGLHPVLPAKPFALPGPLADEECEASRVSVTGCSGLTWHGVEVRFQLLKAEELRGAGFWVRYLTLPGSNLLAAVMTLCNPTTAPLEARPSFAAFPRVGEDATLEVDEDGAVLARRPGRSEAWLTAGGWSAVAGHQGSLVLASPEPFPLVDIKDHSPMWGTMWDMKRRALAPGETVELVLYLVVTDPGGAGGYRCLSRAGGLL